MPTRWNSTFNMLNSLLAIQPVILAAQRGLDGQKIEFGESALQEEDFKHMKMLVGILDPVARATDVLQGSSYCSFLISFGEVRRMKRKLEGMQAEDSPIYGTDFAAVVKALLVQLFETPQRLNPSDMSSAFLTISSLDPSFDPTLWDPDEKKACNSWLREEYAVMLRKQVNAVPSTPGYYSIDGRVTSFETEEAALHAARNLSFSAAQVFQFWTSDSTSVNMPIFSKIAAKYLPFQASSAASERVFSVMNLAVRKDRTRLTPDRVQQIVMLATNWNLVFDRKQVLDVGKLLSLAEDDQEIVIEPQMSLGENDDDLLDL